MSIYFSLFVAFGIIIVPILYKFNKVGVIWLIPLPFIAYLTLLGMSVADLFIFKKSIIFYSISIFISLFLLYCTKNSEKDLQKQLRKKNEKSYKYSKPHWIIDILGSAIFFIVILIFTNNLLSTTLYLIASDKMIIEVDIVKFDRHHYGGRVPRHKRYVRIKKEYQEDEILLTDLQSLNNENVKIFDSLEFNKIKKMKLYGKECFMGFSVQGISNNDE